MKCVAVKEWVREEEEEEEEEEENKDASKRKDAPRVEELQNEINLIWIPQSVLQ